MLTIKSPTLPHGHVSGNHPVTFRDHLATQGGAYAVAWGIWIVYLVIPLFLLMGMVVYLMSYSGPAYERLGGIWFVVMMVWLGAGVPLTFYVRSKTFFKNFWAGKTVSPRNYLKGMVLTWTVIELAGIISLVGCAMTGNLVPNLIPALIAFVVFITQWPSGSAMTDQNGQNPDSSIFKHPR